MCIWHCLHTFWTSFVVILFFVVLIFQITVDFNFVTFLVSFRVVFCAHSLFASLSLDCFFQLRWFCAENYVYCSLLPIACALRVSLMFYFAFAFAVCYCLCLCYVSTYNIILLFLFSLSLLLTQLTSREGKKLLSDSALCTVCTRALFSWRILHAFIFLWTSSFIQWIFFSICWLLLSCCVVSISQKNLTQFHCVHFFLWFCFHTLSRLNILRLLFNPKKVPELSDQLFTYINVYFCLLYSACLLERLCANTTTMEYPGITY